MPRASDELREAMDSYFGDYLDDSAPRNYLVNQGFYSKDWAWDHPYKSWKDCSQKEQDCILFLLEELDEGGWNGS
jgi:hypothetical protein